MLKSFRDSIRSLWQPRGPETVQSRDRKRKRSSREIDEDDSDVEILSVKRPKQEDRNSSPGLLSFLTVPMNKMSAWVRQKTVRQDHVFIRPITQSAGIGRSTSKTKRQSPFNAGSHMNSTNGSSHNYTQIPNTMSRPPLPTSERAHQNGKNGVHRDVFVLDQQPSLCSLSTTSSRRSSCSSIRPGMARPSTIDQCFRLKERENYLKLLQQHTTVDLGYHEDKNKTAFSTGLLPHVHRSKRKPVNFSPVPSSSSSSQQSSRSYLTFVSESQTPTRIRVTPSHTMAPFFPSDRLAENGSSPLWRKDRFSKPYSSGKVEQVHSVSSVNHTSWQHSSQSEKELQKEVVTVSDDDSEEDVIVIEDNTIRKNGHPTALDFKNSEYLDDDWINRLNNKYAQAERERQRLIKEAELKQKLLEERREGRLKNLDKTLLMQLKLFDTEPDVIEELPLDEVCEEKPLPEITESMQRQIDAALCRGPSQEVLSEGFRYRITRADMATLQGLNWLNDEIINFYMQMLMARGEQEGFPKTHAFNTFFYPKLLSGGHSSLRRWTRQVDIFSRDYIVIPIHLGVHWCLSVVFVKKKKICYYDSMGGVNNQCLEAILQYLYDESLEKRKIKLDLSEWSTEMVTDMPQQMNGSDCGIFACVTAETLTRGAELTFTQKEMPYFRQKMVYEILTKKLL